MTFSLFQNPLDLAHHFWKRVVQPGDILIDATCGNGHDTLFLAHLSPRLLYGFDIQPEALETTQKRLEGLLSQDQLRLIQGCHSQFPKEIQPGSVRLLVYNLGYLPGGNKAITTRTRSTLESLQQSLTLLMFGGLISLTCYPGHDEGAREEAALVDFITQLDKEVWSATHQRWLNRRYSPSLLLLQKLQEQPRNSG